MLLRIVAFALSAGVLLAQTPPVAPLETVPPPPPKTVYRYQGKPIALQAQCGEAEIADYGMSCSPDEPCPVYLELSAADSAGSKLLVAGNFHADTSTLWSVLLLSEDSGQSWTEPFDRLRGVALDQVQFPDFVTGFVSGRTAGALSKDPFLLRTSDGGKSWSRLPILEDGAVGLIERFHFDSAARGVAQVDRGRAGAGRYATLDTQSGGDSWVIRESSAVQPVRTSGETVPPIRIAADAKSNSFRVERHENGAWQTVAAFSVAAGSCVAENRAIPSEPPPPGQVH
ncbi:MAG: hypothetical protein P4K98_03020 [Bryobacteraceae bacterium]|nr:hypothetical protein [Bryobacteraceae bacterium]